MVSDTPKSTSVSGHLLTYFSDIWVAIRTTLGWLPRSFSRPLTASTKKMRRVRSHLLELLSLLQKGGNGIGKTPFKRLKTALTTSTDKPRLTLSTVFWVRRPQRAAPIRNDVFSAPYLGHILKHGQQQKKLACPQRGVRMVEEKSVCNSSHFP